MQGPTNVSALGKKKVVDLFSILLVAVVVLAVVSAVAVYRSAFDAGLSLNPDRWSAFGSYVGGVFGPLISFLTLLAILKTIALQKQMIDTQREEFEATRGLQLRSIEAQLSQLRSSDAESARRIIQESRISALQALDRYMNTIRSEHDHKRGQLNALYQWVIDGKAKTSSDEIKRITDKLKEYEMTLASMALLYGELCFGEFADVEALSNKFKEGLKDVWHFSAESEGPAT